MTCDVRRVLRQVVRTCFGHKVLSYFRAYKHARVIQTTQELPVSRSVRVAKGQVRGWQDCRSPGQGGAQADHARSCPSLSPDRGVVCLDGRRILSLLRSGRFFLRSLRHASKEVEPPQLGPAPRPISLLSSASSGPHSRVPRPVARRNCSTAGTTRIVLQVVLVQSQG